MEYFRNLERLDAIQPSLERSFEEALAKHEQTLFNSLRTDLGFGVEGLEGIVYSMAEDYLRTGAWHLTNTDLFNLIIANKKSRDLYHIYFFRAYLFGKRAKQIYNNTDLSEKGKGLAFVYLYHAGVALGHFISYGDKIRKSKYFSELAKNRLVKDDAVHQKLIELIQEKQPSDGWRTLKSMAECLAEDMGTCIVEAGMPIKPKNVEKTILAWVRKHEHIKRVFDRCSAKTLKSSRQGGPVRFL